MQDFDPSHAAVKKKSMINKSSVTNTLALVVSVLGYTSPVHQDLLKNIGFFALSGAITNWLAIYMLFEKIPGLYGSGVIPSRFEEFKAGIRHLIMNQFFNKNNIERFFSEQSQFPSKAISIEPILKSLDYNQLFDKLVEAVKTTQLGGMLALMGGDSALEPVRAPFMEKMKEALLDFSKSESLQRSLKETISQQFDSEDISSKVEDIVDKRLSELTPKMVKDIIQEMIREHLGWLVVWGGIFGGILGFCAHLI